MKFDLNSILLAIEASTPDGRWELLQKWLKENPDYEGLVDQWSEMRPERVFLQIRNLAMEKYETQREIIRLIADSMRERITAAIATLQDCYRERNNQTEKEITNVGTNRPIEKRRSKKNPRRVDTKTK